ncbi:hypothetical protein ACHAXM_010292, partial [Skeletonema potamos]
MLHCTRGIGTQEQFRQQLSACALNLTCVEGERIHSRSSRRTECNVKLSNLSFTLQSLSVCCAIEVLFKILFISTCDVANF